MRSDIFDEYAKIAIKSGLISEGSHKHDALIEKMKNAINDGDYFTLGKLSGDLDKLDNNPMANVMDIIHGFKYFHDPVLKATIIPASEYESFMKGYCVAYHCSPEQMQLQLDSVKMMLDHKKNASYKYAEEDSTPSKPKESAKLKRYKKSPYPRAGSDDISTIEALYGVKPDDSIKYEHNIMEAAHPKPVVIGPLTYDRLNGLVENNIERQNIMSNIALKPNNGNITQHRYAADKELMMQLVRIANDMDNRGHEDIRKIADDCIIELSNEKKKLNKTAILPWIIGGAIVLAGVWLWNHVNDPDKGLTNNLNTAIKKLDDLKTNSWYESGVDSTVQEVISNLENELNKLKASVDSFNSVMADIEKPQSLSDLEKIQQSSSVSPQVKAQLDQFVKDIDESLPYIAAAIKNFNDSAYQEEHTQQGTLSRMTGWLGEALHGKWGLFANEFTSAAEALQPLLDSLKSARAKAMNIDQVKASYARDIAQMINPPAVAEEKTAPSTSEEKPVVEHELHLKEPVQTQTISTKPSGESGGGSGYDNLFKFLGHELSPQEMEFFKI